MHSTRDFSQSAVAAVARRERPFMTATYILPLLGTIAAVAWFDRLPFGWIEAGLCVCFYVLTMLGIEVGYHRLFAHRSFEAPAVTRGFLAIAGSMAAQGPPIRWAAVHRAHHEHSDRPGDPHSPRWRGQERLGLIRGLWNGSFGWLFVKGSWLGLDLARYPRHLLRDPQLVWINMHYFHWVGLGLALPALIAGLAHGSWPGAVSGFLWGGMVRILLTHLAIASVNSLGHVVGGQPFRTHDGSRNIGLLALPTLGASWHNTHHAFPGSAVVGLRWWEIDPAGFCVRVASRLGLVSRFNVANKHMIDSKRVQSGEPPLEDCSEGNVSPEQAPEPALPPDSSAMPPGVADRPRHGSSVRASHLPTPANEQVRQRQTRGESSEPCLMPVRSERRTVTANDEDARHYIVVRNHEEQYSIWMAGRPLPPGWNDAGKHGTKAECLRHIEQIWKDIRPLSLHRALAASDE
jgi:stearoyl-CoA desaturase (Delta-9 desaturase)